MQACQEAPEADYSCGSITTGQFVYENGKAYLYYVDGDDDRYMYHGIIDIKTFVKVIPSNITRLCIVMECILHLDLVKEPERKFFGAILGIWC